MFGAFEYIKYKMIGGHNSFKRKLNHKAGNVQQTETITEMVHWYSVIDVNYIEDI